MYENKPTLLNIDIFYIFALCVKKVRIPQIKFH